jgi:hypothetical protein
MGAGCPQVKAQTMHAVRLPQSMFKAAPWTPSRLALVARTCVWTHPTLRQLPSAFAALFQVSLYSLKGRTCFLDHTPPFLIEEHVVFYCVRVRVRPIILNVCVGAFVRFVML